MMVFSAIRRKVEFSSRWALTRLLSFFPVYKSGRAYQLAIVKLDRLGDFVLALSAIRLLTECVGEQNCVLILSSAAAETASRLFPRAGLIVLPAALGHGKMARNALKVWRQLRTVWADQAVCLRHQRWDYDEIVLSWISAKMIVRCETGYTAGLRPDLRTYWCENPGAFLADDQREVAAASDDILCKEIYRHQWTIEKALDKKISAAELLPRLPTQRSANRRIVVSPFGSETIRDIPLRLLRHALNESLKQGSADLLFIGLPAHQPRLLKLIAQLEIDAPIEIKTGMGQLDFFSAIEGAQLVITAETATAHIAAAYDRPTLIFIGGGHFGDFGPWSRSIKQQWLTFKIACFGCDWKCKFDQPYCLTKITESDITEGVAAALQL